MAELRFESGLPDSEGPVPQIHAASHHATSNWAPASKNWEDAGGTKNNFCTMLSEEKSA